MKGLIKLPVLLFCVLFLFDLPAVSRAEVPVPPLTKRVTDLTGTLNASQISGLEESLASFERARGSQIAVLIVETTQPEAIEQYSMRVVEQWKLGRGKFDDGVLFLVAKGDRRMRIEVGYGLEGAIPDIKAKRIVSDIVTPRFKQSDFYGGIRDGVDALQKLISGENLPVPQKTAGQYSGSSNSFIPFALMIALFVTSISSSISKVIGKIPAGFIGGLLVFLIISFSGAVLVAALVALFVFMLVAFSRAVDTLGRGPFGTTGLGGGYSRGSSWSSRSSGGFSGGGGRFGGGGASGSW